MLYQTIIFSTEHFNVAIPQMPHIDRIDGGHIIIAYKYNDYKTYEDLRYELGFELSKLAIISGKALKSVMLLSGIFIERLNYQINGNWSDSCCDDACPLHLHIYGRVRNSVSQTFGQALFFPDRSTGFYNNFQPLRNEEITSIRRYIELQYQDCPNLDFKNKSFSERAKYYKISRSEDYRLTNAIEKIITTSPGRDVVEIGAGQGSYSNAFLKRGFNVISVEPSTEMQHNSPYKSLRYITSSAEDIALPNNSADAVIVINAIHHFIDVDSSLKEIKRVLRPGGQFIVFTIILEVASKLWLFDYWPSLYDVLAKNYLPFHSLVEKLTASFDAEPNCNTFEIPSDFNDEFAAALWKRPYLFFDNNHVQGSYSLSHIDESDFKSGLYRLRKDLDNGTWNQKYSDMIKRDSLDVGGRIITVKYE